MTFLSVLNIVYFTLNILGETTIFHGAESDGKSSGKNVGEDGCATSSRGWTRRRRRRRKGSGRWSPNPVRGCLCHWPLVDCGHACHYENKQSVRFFFFLFLCSIDSFVPTRHFLPKHLHECNASRFFSHFLSFLSFLSFFLFFPHTQLRNTTPATTSDTCH